ncbi:uncharacterized protein DSM5745_08954 [Aspergillus mulundensis]|uniref:Uncharacterized protein n=1 Tax=Aspergillus mulundensis TaxID=1810919 RepID=A0A3D8QZH5_9EURO|nr:hypothetical protein DSM5745_08954 [Aspergillus mulundensis]RDW67088.1 hypothetical protein DSM5745_08954 [Aspergillus mulundensis]
MDIRDTSQDDLRTIVLLVTRHTTSEPLLPEDMVVLGLWKGMTYIGPGRSRARGPDHLVALDHSLQGLHRYPHQEKGCERRVPVLVVAAVAAPATAATTTAVVAGVEALVEIGVATSGAYRGGSSYDLQLSSYL